MTAGQTERDAALLLVRLGLEAGGRVLPPRSHASRAKRRVFLDAQDNGWLDGDGFVTEVGRAALARWDADAA